MPLNADVLRRQTFQAKPAIYGVRETILYALGVGAGTDDPLSESTLQYTSPRFLKALPTLATILAPVEAEMFSPGAGINWHMAVHGEQQLRIHQVLPATGTLTKQYSLTGLWDKGPSRGAVMAVRCTLRNPSTNELFADMVTTCFLRAEGGFGGSNEGAPHPPVVPDRAPDMFLDLPTRPDQALIYQLSGDFNPLHVDPAFARAAGFDRPILHGLSSYGLTCRAALRLLCNDDPSRLRQFDVRFSKPVYPGETLRTEVWCGEPGQAAFRARVVERDVIVQDRGVIVYV